MASHRVSYSVYYEDTDSLGVVYYANYLKYMERGRTEMLAATGRGVADWNAAGFALVVHSLQMKFRRPARLGDRIDVVSSVTSESPYRCTFHQRVERDGEVLTDATVVIVCVDGDGQLMEVPADIRALAA